MHLVLIELIHLASLRRFIQRPEYLTPNTRFVFREGRTKGIGIVMETEHEFKETTEALLARAAAASAAASKERQQDPLIQ